MPEWVKADFDRYYRVLGERWGRPNTRPSVWTHYHWFGITGPQSGQSPHGLVSPDFPGLLAGVLGLVSGDAVVLVGAGFNGTGAGLEARGVEVIGVETSAYILDNFGQTEEAEIREACLAVGLDPDNDTVIGPPGNVDWNPLDLWLEGGRVNPKARGKGRVVGEDVSKRGGRNKVRQALNANPRYVITEEVINSIPDAEALVVCDAAAQFVVENGGGTVVHMVRPMMQGADTGGTLNWKTYAEWRAFLDANGFAAQRLLPTVTTPERAAYSGLF